MMEKFCNVEDVFKLVAETAGAPVDPIFFNSTVELMRKRMGSYNFDTGLDLENFLVLTTLLKNWYRTPVHAIAEFIDKKFKEKYEVTRSDILGIISKAMEKDEPKEIPESKTVNTNVTVKEPKPEKASEEKDMYKVVQNALKRGMTRTAIQKKYGLNQRELTQYEGYTYWSDSQRADHKAMLEYRRLHPNAGDSETIKEGCKKTLVGYRYALIPTKEEQEAYNQKVAAKPAAKASPKAVIKGLDVKSLILSDEEKEEQQALYSKIKEIATARNCSARDITSLLKSRLVRDYGIVIEQIKKDLMIKYRVNRGEGKATNTLEAIVMSEYLPVAKSILDDMLEESYTVK